jgi:hypothetical protein
METGEVYGYWAISVYVNVDLVARPVVKALAVTNQVMGRQVHNSGFRMKNVCMKPTHTLFYAN